MEIAILPVRKFGSEKTCFRLTNLLSLPRRCKVNLSEKMFLFSTLSNLQSHNVVVVLFCGDEEWKFRKNEEIRQFCLRGWWKLLFFHDVRSVNNVCSREWKNKVSRFWIKKSEEFCFRYASLIGESGERSRVGKFNFGKKNIWQWLKMWISKYPRKRSWKNYEPFGDWIIEDSWNSLTEKWQILCSSRTIDELQTFQFSIQQIVKYSNWIPFEKKCKTKNRTEISLNSNWIFFRLFLQTRLP